MLSRWEMPLVIGARLVVRFKCWFRVDLGTSGSMAGGAGRGCAAGHAASAGATADLPFKPDHQSGADHSRICASECFSPL